MLFFSDLQNQGNKYAAQTLLFRRLFSIMFDIVIRTRMKRKCRTDASWSLCSQKLKVKLRLMSQRMEKRYLVHGPTCHPCGERDLILKVKTEVARRIKGGIKRRETDPASNQFPKCSPQSRTHKEIHRVG